MPDLNSTLFQNSERELFNGAIPAPSTGKAQIEVLNEIKNTNMSNMSVTTLQNYKKIILSCREKILTEQQKEEINELYDKLAECNPKRFGTLVCVAKIKQLEAKRRLAFGELAFKTPSGLPNLDLNLGNNSFIEIFETMFNDNLLGDVSLMKEVGAEFTEDDINKLKGLYAKLEELNPTFKDVFNQYKAPS